MKSETSKENEHFCSALKSHRQKHNWNQRQFAELLNISTPAFSKLECGITDPNLSRLVQIARSMEIKAIDLIDLDASTELKQEIALLKEELEASRLEVARLQGKLIGLYDELRNE